MLLRVCILLQGMFLCLSLYIYIYIYICLPAWLCLAGPASAASPVPHPILRVIFERHTLHYPDTRTPNYVYESLAAVGSNLDNGQPQWTADVGQWTAAYPEPSWAADDCNAELLQFGTSGSQSPNLPLNCV